MPSREPEECIAVLTKEWQTTYQIRNALRLNQYHAQAFLFELLVQNRVKHMKIGKINYWSIDSEGLEI